MSHTPPIKHVTVSTPKELGAVVERCLADRLPLVDYGVAHEGLGHPPPPAHLRLRQRGEILDHWQRDFTVRVAAGATLAQVRDRLAASGQFLPFEADDDVSVGEVIVHNVYGPLRLAYGGPRDLLLGLGYIDGHGQEVHAGGRTVKNVAGYDLTRLMVGSLGELGVVYEATVRTYAIPPQVLAVTVAVSDPADVDRLIPQWLLTDAAPTYLSLDRECARWILQVGYFGSSAACAAHLKALETLIEQAPGMHILGSGTRTFAQDDFVRRQRLAWIRTVAAVVKLITPPARACDTAAQLLRDDQLPISNLHVLPAHGCLFLGGSLDAAAATVLDTAVTRLTREVGGVRFWHRRPAGAQGLAPFAPPLPDWPMLARLKQSMDPAGIFNPGRFLPLKNQGAHA